MRTLEEAIAELTPEPDRDFAAAMERRMLEGFPPRRPPRVARPEVVLPRFRRPALAAALASGALALVIALAVTQEERPAGPDRPVALEAPAPQIAETGASARDDRALESEIAPLPPDGGVAPGARERSVERSANLTLAAEAERFDTIADSVVAIADRRGGFVMSSSLSEGEGGASAFFDLRVPADALERTLNELSLLATVRARGESGTDVTGALVGVRDRLRAARAERDSLLRRLERAGSDRAARAIRARLDVVAGELNGLRTQLRGLRERTELATLAVELVDRDGAGAPPRGEAGEAVDDALGALEEIGVFLIRALGIALPVGLAAGAGWLAAGWVRRRARERTLA